MGAKESKPAFLTYEEALKRVSDAELKRLKDAFKRSSVLSGHMTRSVFIQEVLGDGVPPRLAEEMFVAFGGVQKGINFKDLLCGLVLLTRGKQEEKIKFAFGLYANEDYTHVQKEQMDGLVLEMEGHVPHSLSDLFIQSDCVTYEMFRTWLLKHTDVTSITKWLLRDPVTVTLSNDLETPTFHQTLAGVTHLEETDIMELEKRYWVLKAQSSSGRFDLDTFRPIVSPPVPSALCEGLFRAFDENCDNHIDFKEMACGISASCRGPLTERQKFCFKVFDTDRDGRLSRTELTNMVEAMLAIRKENKTRSKLASDGLDSVSVQQIVADILAYHDGGGGDDDDGGDDGGGGITQEEYLVWTVKHQLSSGFLQLLFQICHIVLGLKPQNKIHEAQVVSGWMEREEMRGMKTAQVWYLVSTNWWTQWADYVNYEHQAADVASNNNEPADCFPILNSPASLCANSSYSTLPLHATTTTGASGSPRRYATLPGRASPSRASPSRASPSRASPARSSPRCPSPRVSKRGGGAERAAGGVAQRPGAVDNSALIVASTSRVLTLTNEGGRLKGDKMLTIDREFKLLPESVWKAVSSWYGSSTALPRTVIHPRDAVSPELELYPVCVRLMRHQLASQRPGGSQTTSFTEVVGGLGGYMMSTAAGLSGASQPVSPRKYLAYTAAFSRKHTLRQIFEFLVSRLRISKEDMRLWKIKDEQNMTLLEEEELTVEDMGIEDNMQLLIEVRNKDLTWPEELSQLAKDKSSINRSKQVATTRGASGLNNLGNTCFMNSALQCVSNTRILTHYFNRGMHLYELNRTNPLGMKGHIAQRYGELVKDLWSGTMKSIAPLKFRWTIGKYTPRFNGFQQHDSQEMLAFLLDGLHEDLNRVHVKPYVELKDSDGRPDLEVAKEAWDNHLLRNGSVVVDLFHGQLKSCVRCKQCGHTSVRFDPFTYLSLPLPMESCVHLEIVVVYLDGSPPTKYGLRLTIDEKYKGLKTQLAQLCNIPAHQILLVEVFGALVKTFLDEKQKVKGLLNGSLYAYQLPAAPIPQQTGTDLSTDNTLAKGALQKSLPSPKGGVVRPAGGGLSPSRSLQLAVNGAQRAINGAQRGVIGAQRASGSLVNGSVSRAGVHCGVAVRAAAGPPVKGMANGVVNGGLHITTGVRPRTEAMTGTTASPARIAAARTTPDATPAHVAAKSDADLSDGSDGDGDRLAGFTIAVHRKMFHMDVYFLSSQKSRPSLFGTPLLLPCHAGTTNQDLYRSVWIQVSRLVSPLPPSEVHTHNHAQDCDDSLGYEYPFLLKVVKKDGLTCAWCPWYRFCRGCPLEYSDDLFHSGSSYVAVDWEPTALHLRYQTSQEKVHCEHSSVAESRRRQTEPIDLDACLRAFTKQEELGEDELYYCSKCKQHRLAVKKLDIWQLPPILIIHLKRFQFLNNRWVKSQKIVKFPASDFDPSNYLAPRCQARHGDTGTSDTVTAAGDMSTAAGDMATAAGDTATAAGDRLTAAGDRHAGDMVAAAGDTTTVAGDMLTAAGDRHAGDTSTSYGDTATAAGDRLTATGDTATVAGDRLTAAGDMSTAAGDTVTVTGDRLTAAGDMSTAAGDTATAAGDRLTAANGNSHDSLTQHVDEDLPEKSVSPNSVSSEVVDYATSPDHSAIDSNNAKYDLYAMSCHTGILGGGHYVCYAKNPNSRWYCYNDSSCKEVSADQLDTNTAYILFYERQNLDCLSFMPDISGHVPDTAEIDDDFESEFKKICCVQ